MAMSLLQIYEKVLGTIVPFDDYREPNMDYFIFPNETFGVYAYQALPATVDSATLDAFRNGDANDLRTVIEANGMQLRYLRVSWNEEGNRVTDMVVGVVVAATMPRDVNGNNLVKVMKYIGWFNNLISKLSMPWKVYVLVQKPQTQVQQTSYRWVWDAVSAPYELSSLTGFPSPPSVDEVRSHFVNDGKVDQALGEFVRRMLNEGYQITLLGYQVGICYETVRTWQYRDHTYAEYRTHTRLSVEYLSSPELSLSNGRPIRLIAPILVNIIYAIIAAIVVGALGYFAITNLTTQQVITEDYGWVLNQETGVWEWKVIKRTTETGPPEWWGTVFTTLALGAVAIVGAVIIIPPVIRSLRTERE